MIEVAAEDSAEYDPGEYTWFARITDGDDVKTLSRGVIKILPDFGSEDTYDARSPVKKTLDAIIAMIEGRATKEHEEYTIGNRSLKLIPITELLTLRDRYQADYNRELNQERVRNGGKSRTFILGKF